MTFRDFGDTPAARVDQTPPQAPKRPPLSAYAGKVLLVRSAVRKVNRDTQNEYWTLAFQVKGEPGVKEANTGSYGISKALEALKPEHYPFAARLVMEGKALRFTSAATSNGTPPEPAPATPEPEPDMIALAAPSTPEAQQEAAEPSLEHLPNSHKGRH